MAEMRKRFTQQAGYQNALDFDPVNGIVKFGNYEAFVTQLVKPTSQQFKFDDYLAALDPLSGSGMATQSMATSKTPAEIAKLKEQFLSDLSGGRLSYTTEPANTGSAITSNQALPATTKPRLVIGGTGSGLPWAGAPSDNGTPAAFRKVIDLGNGTYGVDTYGIPDDQEAGYNLLNKLSAASLGIGQVRRDTALLAQNKADAALKRQGAGSTVLSVANNASSAAAKAINT